MKLNVRKGGKKEKAKKRRVWTECSQEVVCVCARTHACVCLCVCKLSAILLNNPDAITLHLHADLIRKR